MRKRRKKRRNVNRVYMAIGVNPILQHVTVLAMDDTSEDTVFHTGRNRAGEFDFVRAFEFDESLGERLCEFLVDCKVPQSQRARIVQQIGRELLALADD